MLFVLESCEVLQVYSCFSVADTVILGKFIYAEYIAISIIASYSYLMRWRLDGALWQTLSINLGWKKLNKCCNLLYDLSGLALVLLM